MSFIARPYRYRRSTKLPTSRRYVDPTPDDRIVRRSMYAEIKQGPRTASWLADAFDLDIGAAIDHLRILENFDVVDHKADNRGVIRWQPRPGNAWEMGPTPF